MFSKPLVPCVCAVVAVLCFALSHFLSEGKADTIDQTGDPSNPRGSACCRVSGGCPGASYGCRPESYNCADIPCVFWNITDILALGSCQNNYQGNCAQFSPFYCARGPLYTDPHSTGQCREENIQCFLYIYVPQGCVYQLLSNCVKPIGGGTP